MDQAYALGEAAVEFVRGRQRRHALYARPRQALSLVHRRGTAGGCRQPGKEKCRNYITRDGFGITPRPWLYLSPLIAGEASPDYRHGMPVYVRLKTPGAAETEKAFPVPR